MYIYIYIYIYVYLLPFFQRGKYFTNPFYFHEMEKNLNSLQYFQIEKKYQIEKLENTFISTK